MNLPNRLTTLRMFLVPIVILLLILPIELNIDLPSYNFKYGSFNLSYLLAAILFIIASFTDYLDGKIARNRNLVTTYGKFMDPIADKLLVNSLFIILTYTGEIPVYITLVIILRDIFVDGIRLVVASSGTVISANVWGKLKTILQMLAIPIVLLNNLPFSLWLSFDVAFVLCALAATASFLSGVSYFYRSYDLVFKNR